MRILLVLGTIRTGRRSIKVANFLRDLLQQREGVEVDFVDLKELDLPMLWERNHHMDDADKPEGLESWHQSMDQSDGVILVAPEYNGSYPAVLKNALDALYPEYRRKPFALTSVSAGYGGYTVLSHLTESIHRFKGLVVPATFMARNVTDAFDDEGNCINEFYPKAANQMIDELLFFAEAINRQTQRMEE